MNVRSTVDFLLSRALVVIMTAMVLNVLWQVFSRYVLGAPSSFTDELARYLMIWLGVLGAAYASGQRMHVAIDILPRRLSERAQRNLRYLSDGCIVLFCLFGLIFGGGRLVYVTLKLEQYSPALGLPLAVVYLVLPLSGALILYYKFSDLTHR